MTMTKLTPILSGIIAFAGVIATLAIQHHTQVELRENDTLLRRQDDQLTILAAENQRLSHRLAPAKGPPAEDPAPELAKLRRQAAALRQQAGELAKQTGESGRPWRGQDHSGPDTSKPSHVSSSVVSASRSEEYKSQLYELACADPHSFPPTNNKTMADARNLGSALRKYAREHEGELPANFDQAAPYFYQDQPSPRSGEFEMVFQGSLNELTAVPPEAVALLRERQAWPTPGGKWARIYVMAGGSPLVVESDDSFQSWEAAHLVPPPSAGR